MRRIVLGILVTLLLLCVAGVGGGYLLIRRTVRNADDAFVEVMATELHTSASEVIDHAAANPTAVRFLEDDLTVNNAERPGEAGYETGTDGTIIYGTTLEIETGGLSLVINGAVLYTGRPQVIDGEFVLADVESQINMMGWLFDAKDFKAVVETAFADAFADHGLTPTGLILHDGVMIVKVQVES